MKRLLALSSWLLALSFSIQAADITPNEAIRIANDFVQHDQTAKANIRKAPAGTKVSPSIAHKMPSRVVADKDNVYIINLGNEQGFVIVSGEDGAVSDILGYCDHGSFSYEDAPIQFLDLLNEYSAGIDTLRQNPVLARMKASYPSYIGDVVVEPLLTTTWNQTAPYNNQCPSGDNGHCYTGCVPTAVAQVMRYWKWPATYDWDNMLDYYGWSYASDDYISYNSTQVNAVARLMADIGRAMHTSYCQANGSPTPWSYEALVDSFGYSQGINIVYGDKAANVKSALISELDAKRPVLYSGNPTQGDGHALVCDGYTANNYFHFNYGWGGQTDGFYRLSAVPMYINNVSIWTNVRPYDAIEKVIDGIKYGLLPNGTADILNYVAGSYGSQNGVLVIPDSVTDPDTGTRYAVTHICKHAFFRKGNFTKMIVGNNIEAVDPISFMYTKIDTIVLSDKMEVVPEQAFALTDVEHLTIGANVKRIGVRAFYLCPLNDIVCKSPRVELERECFLLAKPKHGDWEKSIVKIGKKAFSGAYLDRDTYFENLEVLGDSAMTNSIWTNYGTLHFRIGPKVREIAQSAFDGFGQGIYSPMIMIDNQNPYFTIDFDPIIYNKDTTSVHLVLSRGNYINKTRVIKLEPGCIRGTMSHITIPPTVVDMEGAFKDCKPPMYYAKVTCPHMVPPVISDATFPDTLFWEGAADMLLKVPAGTEQLYAEAPGWRKFGENIGAMDEGDFVPMPAQDLSYQMKLHGDSLHIAAPIADVSSMRMTEENGEATVTLSVNGRVDLQTPVSNIDSIIFVPGFIYEGAEIFEINDSSLTVEAQKCSVTFEPTTFDENAQVCVRNSVLLPRPMEGVTGGIGIDISMLNDSGRVHELSGVATITIPFEVPADQSVGAAYFNEETGEWDPVYMEYDREAGVATIMTDHLSYFAFVSVTNESTKTEILEALKEIPEFYLWDQATKKLLDILGSDDPEVQQAIEFKDEMGLWQSIGLDGFYNGVVAVTEPLFNFKPECIDNAVTIMGNIGTALTVLDVIRADLHGDQIAVASGTLKVIMAQTSGAAVSAIGTPIMAASMSMVAFIGIALEKFGTDMQNAKTDYFRSAYSLYYSMAGYEILKGRSSYAKDKNGKPKPHGHFRTAKDWYDYFYPMFLETDWDADRLMRYIEQSVRMYCDQFWQEASDNRDDILLEIGNQGIFLKPTTYPNEAVQKQISDEYYAELMNGELVSVFTALRNKQITQAHNRLVSKINNMAKLMNKKVGFKITDSSITEGQPSRFSGYTIGFPVLDERVSDPDKWRKTIGDDCQVALGWFTTYALVRNLVPFKLTLYNQAGEAVKDFDFELDGVAEKKTIHIDLATQGISVENKHLDDLHLTYDPVAVDFFFAGIDANDMYQDPLLDELVYMDEEINPYKNQTRWCTEVERFFNNHDFITVDTTGNFTIGDDIIGKFEGDSASGTFIINTDYKFFIRTAQQYLNMWNNEKSTFYERIKIVLNGSLKHQIACTYKIKRRQAGDHDEYDITYTGQGAFDMTARHINNFNKSIDWVTMVTTNDCPSLSMSEIGIGTSSDGGDVTLEYTVTIAPAQTTQQPTE